MQRRLVGRWVRFVGFGGLCAGLLAAWAGHPSGLTALLGCGLVVLSGYAVSGPRVADLPGPQTRRDEPDGTTLIARAPSPIRDLLWIPWAGAMFFLMTRVLDGDPGVLPAAGAFALLAVSSVFPGAPYRWVRLSSRRVDTGIARADALRAGDLDWNERTPDVSVELTDLADVRLVGGFLTCTDDSGRVHRIDLHAIDEGTRQGFADGVIAVWTRVRSGVAEDRVVAEGRLAAVRALEAR